MGGTLGDKRGEKPGADAMECYTPENNMSVNRGLNQEEILVFRGITKFTYEWRRGVFHV